MDKVTGQCPQTATFLKRKESRSGIEPRSFRLQPNALPLGQTGSHLNAGYLNAVVSEIRNRVKVEVVVLGSPSLIRW